MPKEKKKLFVGLREAEVQQRIAEGKINKTDDQTTRSVKQIVQSNVLTFFNLINVILFALVITTGSFKNMFFIFIIAINTVIGIIQELRSKKILDKLAILTASQATVIRDGKKKEIAIEDIVLDDLILLKNGDQIPADGVVVEGGIEVNESLLTGESDSILKKVDSEVYSGSFVTAGRALCQVLHVGKDNYMEQITKEAKQFKKHNSELRNCINKILKIISMIIVPVGVGLFCKQFFIEDLGYKTATLNTVAAVLGMIPEGLVLLTSVALTIGVIRLAQRKTLVQELYCIETLARVDVLCLDKTGTITEGSICVEQVETIDGITDIDEVMGNMVAALNDDNATFQALKKEFAAKETMSPSFVIPFSSERKYSGVAFHGYGTYFIGAIQFLFPEGQEELKEIVANHAAKGYRMLIVGHSTQECKSEQCPTDLKPCALIMMTDIIRPEAPRTLRYFKEQNVDLKIISGDDPVTVAAVAKKAGLENAENFVDATTLKSESELAEALQTCSVFGRVTPKQKKMMVTLLKAAGHTVAMTGDGVNDVLALKEADCSIAMASGSEAAKNTANLVLLDSNFASMPHIVNEGRRVINNIRNAASMFLIKTMFSAILAVITILIGQKYPFQPIQLSVISFCAVGLPGFLLQQEPSFERVEKNFLQTVFGRAFPTAAVISISIFLFKTLGVWLGCTDTMITTICVLATGWLYMITLKRVYSPLTKYRKIVIYSMQVMYMLGLIIFQKLLELGTINFNAVMLLLIVINFASAGIDAMGRFYQYVLRKSDERRRLSNASILSMSTPEQDELLYGKRDEDDID